MDVHTKLKERLQARVKREGKKVSKKGKTSILFFLFQLTEGWRTNTNPASMVGRKSYTKTSAYSRGRRQGKNYFNSFLISCKKS